MNLKEEDIKKLIGKLKCLMDVWEFRQQKTHSYISRLEQHLKSDFKEKEYEKMIKRDECLLEEIDSFMDSFMEVIK